MSAPERVPVPQLATRTSTLWGAGTVVAVLAVVISVGITQPENRWVAAGGMAVLLVAVLGLVSARMWVEPATGTVVCESFWYRRRCADLRTARSVALVDNRGGALLLGITHRRTLYLPVLALTDHVERSQPPEFLRLLADQIDAHAPGAREVATQLRGQADFVAAGGAPAASPLAPRVTRGVLVAAKAGGLGALFR